MSGSIGRAFPADAAPTAAEDARRAEAVQDVLHDRPVAPPPVAPPAQGRPARLSLASIDVLRALAAVTVVLYHIDVLFVARPAGGLALALSEAVNFGWLGVPLFFVISGFCIHLPYALAPRISPREYTIRRLVRIWPPYAAVLLAGTVAAIVGGHASWKLVPQLFTHLGFLLVGRSPIREDNVVLWSIVVEVQLYFLYLAIRMFSPRWMTLARWTIAFCAFGIAYHLIVFFFPLPGALERVINPRFFAPARMGDWLLGALIADALVRHAQRSRGETATAAQTWRSLLFVVAGVATIAASRAATHVFDLAVRRPDHHGKYTLESFDALGFAMLVLGLVFLEQRARGADAPDARPHWLVRGLVAVGQRCYSLYLFHFPVLVWSTGAAIAWGIVRVNGPIELGASRAGWAVIAAAVVLVILATELSYRLVERPSHALARRWGRPRA